jgi:hypothetical protein
VLLPEDITAFASLIRRHGLNEEEKTEDRNKIAGRIELFRSVIAAGLRALLAERADGKRGRRNTTRSTTEDQEPATTACATVHRALERLPLWNAPSEVPFRNGLDTFSHGLCSTIRLFQKIQTRLEKRF